MTENPWRFNGFEDPPTLEKREKEGTTNPYRTATRKGVWQQRHRETIAEAIDVIYTSMENYLGYAPRPTWEESITIPLSRQIRQGSSQWFNSNIYIPQKRHLIRFGRPVYKEYENKGVTDSDLKYGLKRDTTWGNEEEQKNHSYYKIMHKDPAGVEVSIRIDESDGEFTHYPPRLADLRERYHCFIGLQTDQQVNVLNTESRELERNYEIIKVISGTAAAKDRIFRYEFSIPAWDMNNIQTLWENYLLDTDIIYDDITDYIGEERPIHSIRVTLPVALTTLSTADKDEFVIVTDTGTVPADDISEVILTRTTPPNEEGVITFILPNGVSLENPPTEVVIINYTRPGSGGLGWAVGGEIGDIGDNFVTDMPDRTGIDDFDGTTLPKEIIYRNWDTHPALGGDPDAGQDDFFEFYELEVDTANSATLLFYPDSTNSSESGVQEVDVTPYVVNGEKGVFALKNKTITSQSGPPYAVRVDYEHGLPLNHRGHMDVDIERAIFILANNAVTTKVLPHSSSPETLPFSENAAELFLSDREEVWGEDKDRLYIEAEYVNPLGLRHGHVEAWKTIERRADRVKSSLAKWL